jgi:hypothetical protein
VGIIFIYITQENIAGPIKLKNNLSIHVKLTTKNLKQIDINSGPQFRIVPVYTPTYIYTYTHIYIYIYIQASPVSTDSVSAVSIKRS